MEKETKPGDVKSVFEWRSGQSFSLWSTCLLSLLFLGLGTVIAIYYSRGSLILHVCEARINIRCIDAGRNYAISCIVLFCIMTVASVQIGEIVYPESVWKSLAQLLFPINPTVKRFSLTFSLLVVILSTPILAWNIFRAYDLPHPPALEYRTLVSVGLMLTLLTLVLECVFNWSDISPRIGNIVRGILTFGFVSLFLVARYWAGWSWSSVGIVAGVVAGGVGLWHWLAPLGPE